MKNSIEPTQQERVMREDDFLVSKTDMKGRIVYGNQIFIEYSGYQEHELLGTQHNIVRHPDMPRGVFKFLWDCILARKECFAYVKNMSKDGGFYWVFANVTPSINAKGELEGFFSVRRKPRPQAIAAVSEVYRQMLDIEKQAGTKDACDASIAFLNKVLAEQGVTYETFILSI